MGDRTVLPMVAIEGPVRPPEEAAMSTPRPSRTRRPGNRRPQACLGLERLEERCLMDAAGTAFVSKAFKDLLNRPAETAAVNYFSGLLDQGTSRTQVVLDIESTQVSHHLCRCKPISPTCTAPQTQRVRPTPSKYWPAPAPGSALVAVDQFKRIFSNAGRRHQ